MKKLLILGLILVSCGTATVNNQPDQQFMPDNDLWKYDSQEMATGISQELFNQIIDAGIEAYTPYAKANNETLKINKLWSDSTVNANVSRSRGKVTVNMYGGLARREEVIPEGFALVLCHEVGGHSYGGAPYIQVSNKLSAEGQADFKGAQECFEKIQKLVPTLQERKDKYNDYVLNKCGDNIKCLNGLEGGLSLGKLLAVLQDETIPTYETPDTTEVSQTELSYPATVQCRVDTYHAGILNLARPKCWFKN